MKGIKKVKEGQKKVQLIRECWVKRTKRKHCICQRRPWKRMVKIETVKILKEKMAGPKKENRDEQSLI